MSTTMFSPAQLDKIINETIPDATNAGHTNAIVLGVDQTGAQVVAHFQVDESGNWTLNAEAVGRHTWSGDNEVGARVALAW
jgi:hypothetical protein